VTVSPMAGYNAVGLEVYDSRIEEGLRLVTREVRRVWGGRLFSLVAVGSVGRAYAAGLQASRLRPDDYDVVAIVDTDLITARRLERKTTRALAGVSGFLGRPVSLGVFRKTELPQLPFTLFNYELRYGSHVLDGRDPSEALPPYQVERMPLIEATRLLLNRGVMLWGDALSVRNSVLLPHDTLKIAARNRKAIMAFGDALLIAQGGFHWSYSRRVERAHTCGLFDRVGVPHLRQRYTEATIRKLEGEPPKVNAETLPSETQLLFSVHEQLFRYLEELRLERELGEWDLYAVSNLGYPENLREASLKRLVHLLQTFGPPRGNEFYRWHWTRSVEEVLLMAFPHIAYQSPDVSFLRRALNWHGRSDPAPVAVWNFFRRLWRGGC
jgi:hypothetical protein